MSIHMEGRRVVARGITFINDQILLIERYKRDNNKLLHYYTIPGGGVEEDETYQDAAIRETKEETTCDVEIIEYLGEEYYPGGICHWFYCKYINGTPILSGEEKERNTKDNSYKVVLVNMKDIDSINILGKGKDYIKQCYLKYKNTKK